MSWTKILEEKNKSEMELDPLVHRISALLGEHFCCYLIGDLAAGKTEFVKRFGRLHGFTSVTSPTFSVHQNYENTKNQSLDHFDLYRMKSKIDLESTGFFETVQSGKMIFIEWPQYFTEKEMQQVGRPLFKLEIQTQVNARDYLLSSWK